MEENKKENFRKPGGMYAGVDVPVKLLDGVIVAGIILLALLIFA